MSGIGGFSRRSPAGVVIVSCSWDEFTPRCAMAILSCPELLDWLEQNQFLTPPQVQPLRVLVVSFPDPHALARELIRRDWLTPYQVNQILQGKHEQLLVDS